MEVPYLSICRRTRSNCNFHCFFFVFFQPPFGSDNVFEIFFSEISLEHIYRLKKNGKKKMSINVCNVHLLAGIRNDYDRLSFDAAFAKNKILRTKRNDIVFLLFFIVFFCFLFSCVHQKCDEKFLKYYKCEQLATMTRIE